MTIPDDVTEHLSCDLTDQADTLNQIEETVNQLIKELVNNQ